MVKRRVLRMQRSIQGQCRGLFPRAKPIAPMEVASAAVPGVRVSPGSCQPNVVQHGWEHCRGLGIPAGGPGEHCIVPPARLAAKQGGTLLLRCSQCRQAAGGPKNRLAQPWCHRLPCLPLWARRCELGPCGSCWALPVQSLQQQSSVCSLISTHGEVSSCEKGTSTGWHRSAGAGRLWEPGHWGRGGGRRPLPGGWGPLAVPVPSSSHCLALRCDVCSACLGVPSWGGAWQGWPQGHAQHPPLSSSPSSTASRCPARHQTQTDTAVVQMQFVFSVHAGKTPIHQSWEWAADPTAQSCSTSRAPPAPSPRDMPPAWAGRTLLLPYPSLWGHGIVTRGAPWDTGDAQLQACLPRALPQLLRCLTCSGLTSSARAARLPRLSPKLASLPCTAEHLGAQT